MRNILLTLLLCCSSSLFAIDHLPWLRAEGERIVNEQGQTVVLRGINLGSWFAEELWMLPFETKSPHPAAFPDVEDRTSLWKVMQTRFGAKDMHEIRESMRRAWLTDADFGRIRDAGLNCVRLPFLADMFEEEGGLFPWLDYAIDTASKHNIYVILDMHGTPGRQSDKQHSGEVNRDQLFKDPAMVQKTALLWEKIAARYKNRPVVAGYDLINEPMGAQNTSTLHLVYDQLYRAVRGEDTKHLVFMEDGFKGIEYMPVPHTVGWRNVVFSSHAYAKKATSEAEILQKVQSLLATYTALQTSHKAPIYLGEFNVHPHGTAKTVQSIITSLQSKDISWSIWAYKVGKKVGKESTWGLYRCPKKMQKIDPFKDSKKEILKKIQQLRTENFEENRELKEAFRATMR